MSLLFVKLYLPYLPSAVNFIYIYIYIKTAVDSYFLILSI